MISRSRPLSFCTTAAMATVTAAGEGGGGEGYGSGSEGDGGEGGYGGDGGEGEGVMISPAAHIRAGRRGCGVCDRVCICRGQAHLCLGTMAGPLRRGSADLSALRVRSKHGRPRPPRPPPTPPGHHCHSRPRLHSASGCASSSGASP